MKWSEQSKLGDIRVNDRGAMSRRRIVRAAGIAGLGLLAGSALGREPDRKPRAAGPASEGSREARQRAEQFKALAERMRDAGSMEERMKIMAERTAMARQRAIEEFKSRLGVSDAEWSVVKPRLEAVYNLVRPMSQIRGPGARTQTEVEQKRQLLRQLLAEKETEADRLKTALTALRAARERDRQKLARARQDLRRLLTLRQEAELVLAALLD